MARKLGTWVFGTVSARKHALDILHQNKGPRSPMPFLRTTTPSVVIHTTVHDNDMPTHITRQQDNQFTLARACQVVILDLSCSGSGPIVVCLILCLGPRWPPASQHQVRRLHMPRFQHRHPQHIHLQQIQSGGASLGWLAAGSLPSIPVPRFLSLKSPKSKPPIAFFESFVPSHPILPQGQSALLPLMFSPPDAPPAVKPLLEPAFSINHVGHARALRSSPSLSVLCLLGLLPN